MSLKTEIQTQINRLQAELTILNSAPEDIYNFGTIALFSNNNNLKWYYTKVGEELWRPPGGGTEKPLSEWILAAKQNNTYFEVYIMTPSSSPIYASD